MDYETEQFSSIDDLYTQMNARKMDIELQRLSTIFDVENNMKDIDTTQLQTQVNGISKFLEYHDNQTFKNTSDILKERNELKTDLEKPIDNPLNQTNQNVRDADYINVDLKYRHSINMITRAKTVHKYSSKKVINKIDRTMYYKITDEVEHTTVDSFYPLRPYERNPEKIRLLTYESTQNTFDETYYHQQLNKFNNIHNINMSGKYIERPQYENYTMLSRYLQTIAQSIGQRFIYIDIGCRDGFYADAVARIINMRHNNCLITANQVFNISSNAPLFYGIDIDKTTNIHKLKKAYSYLTDGILVYLKATRLIEPHKSFEGYFNILDTESKISKQYITGHFITCVNYFSRMNHNLHVQTLINIASIVEKGGLLYIEDYDLHPLDEDYGTLMGDYLKINPKNFPYRGLLIYILINLLGFEIVEEYTEFNGNIANKFRILFVNKHMSRDTKSILGTNIINIEVPPPKQKITYELEDLYEKYVKPDLNNHTFDELSNYLLNISRHYTDETKYAQYKLRMTEIENKQQIAMIYKSELLYEDYVSESTNIYKEFKKLMNTGSGIVLHNTIKYIDKFNTLEDFKYKSNDGRPFDQFYQQIEINEAKEEQISHDYLFHFGQLKLLISEILILMNPEYSRNIKYIIYVGAAPGNHLPIIYKLFRHLNLKFILYDGAKFNTTLIEISKDFKNPYVEIPDVNYRTRQGSLFDDYALNKIKRRMQLPEDNPNYIDKDKTFFISDIRNKTYSNEDKYLAGPDNEAIMFDMLLQQYWVEELKPRYTLFKTRFPWDDAIEQNVVYNVRNMLINMPITPTSMKTPEYLERFDKMFKVITTYDDFGTSINHLKFNYLNGQIYIQAYGRIGTRETRLFIDSELHKYEQNEWDCHDYDFRLNYFNQHIRGLYYDTSLSIEDEVEGYCSCYDCKVFDHACNEIFKMGLFEENDFKSAKEIKQYITSFLTDDGESHYFIRHFIRNNSKRNSTKYKLLMREIQTKQKEMISMFSTSQIETIPTETTPLIGIETQGQSPTKELIQQEGGDRLYDTQHIKCVLFDWGGTLAKPNQRMKFLKGSPSEKLSTLWNDTIDTLQYLRMLNIKIGIISNTRHDSEELKKALRDVKMDIYFDIQVYSSEKGMCKKNCAHIFETTIEKLGVKPNECIYVGDNYQKDINGSLKVGILPIHLNKSFDDKIGYDSNGILTIKNLKELKDLVKTDV